MNGYANEPDAIVAVPIFGSLKLAARCLAAFDERTPHNVEILVVDDCGPARFTDLELERLFALSGRRWRYVRNPFNMGFPGTANRIFALTAPRDVVLMNSDVEVLEGWWPALQEAAMAPRVASASAMTDRGTILSVPAVSAARGWAPGELLSRLVSAELDSRSVPIPVAVGHCSYLRRPALDETGPFDEAFSPGYGEEVDWSLRARRLGWRHVAAVGSLVLHEGGASFTPQGRRAVIRAHERIIVRRYPWRFVQIRIVGRLPFNALGRARTSLSMALAP